MSQFTLPISLPPVFSEDNFFVAGCNQEAHRWIMRWPDWKTHALIIYSPTGAGKSHLGHIWAERANAKTTTLPLAPETVRGNLLIEDIEKITDEQALFHLLNLAKENKYSLLLTSNVAPNRLPFELPDLTSRLLALPAIGIGAPDDMLLAAVLHKQFADRQLKVEDGVIAFLLPRIERSFTQAVKIVDILDKKALAEQRNLTVPFVKRVLGY
jgi:chromosomal replication initiation ATPase DnaA